MVEGVESPSFGDSKIGKALHCKDHKLDGVSSTWRKRNGVDPELMVHVAREEMIKLMGVADPDDLGNQQATGKQPEAPYSPAKFALRASCLVTTETVGRWHSKEV